MRLSSLLEYWAHLSIGELLRHASFYVFLSILLVVVGPFGTDGDPVVWRFGYWMLMLCFFGGVIMPGLARVSRRIAPIGDLPVLPGAVLCLLVACVPMTVFVAGVDIALSSVMTHSPPMSPAFAARMRGEFPSVASLVASFPGRSAGLFAQVFAITFIGMALISIRVVGRLAREERSDALAAPAPQWLKFFARLPPGLGRDLVLLQMEDHYIRVVTREGTALVLLRMADAVAELAGYSGLRVHRSWWVATPHVASVALNGRRLELIMTDGSVVPVSSSYRALTERTLGLV